MTPASSVPRSASAPPTVASRARRAGLLACIRHAATLPDVQIHGLFLALSALFCSRFFFLTDLNSHAILDGDPALMNWQLQWVSRALYSDPFNLFNGNAFHPHPNSIALTEHMLSLAVLNIPARLLFDSPWAGYNLLIFLAYFLSCAGGYRLVREVTGSRHAAVWAGIFWGFMFFRVHHIGHLQILSCQWMPFLAVALVRFQRGPTVRRGLVFALFFVLQALVSWYLAVITALLVLVVAASHIKLEHLAFGRLGRYAAVIALCAAAIVPFALPYMRSFAETDLGDRLARALAVGDAISIADYLIPPLATFAGQIRGEGPWIWEENTLYVGYTALVMSVVGLLAFVEARQAASTVAPARWVAAGICLIVAGFVLAKGFVWHDVRLPLFHLSELPGLDFIKGMRAPQRFSLLLYFGIMLLSGIGAAALAARMRTQAAKVIITAVLCALFLVEVYPYRLPIMPRRYEVSQLDRAIAELRRDRPAPVVLHVPIYYFLRPYATPEAVYLLDSTHHWSKVVNGFSGAEPRGFRADMEALNALPDHRGVAKLAELSVDVVAIHRTTPGARRRALVAFFEEAPWATVVSVEGEHLVLIDQIPERSTSSVSDGA